MVKKKKKVSRTKRDESLTFEESLERLEAIVGQLETGQIGLNESLQKYQEGVQYLADCHAALKDVEKQIKMVVSMDAEGNARLAPFDDEKSSEEVESGAKARPQKKRRKPAREREIDDEGERLF